MKRKLLSNLRDVLMNAKLHNYAVAQININNLEWIKTVLNVAQESNTPIILGVSEGAGKYMGGYKNIHDMVINLIDYYHITIPVVLHLDHGSYQACIEALEAGFSSVMYDGSMKPFEINFDETFAITKIAAKYNASVEAEVGGIGGIEDGHTSLGEIADINECIAMSKLPIDALAASVGSIHGLYPKEWESLDFELLNEINAATNLIPLVLHGGSGIPDAQIKQAIALGVSKINVNTECQIAFAQAIREYIEQNKDLDINNKGYDPRKLLKVGCNAIKKVCLEKFKLFGSLGVAD